MKKITLSLLMAFAVIVANASTRMCLVEEFTQASCGPCASQNPAFNTLLNANQPPTSNKVISIKYQTSWPGVDPMNAHNQSDVAARVTYYGVSGVPHACLDGTAIPNDCSAYLGAPACLSQGEIDTRYAVSSPIDITLNHVFNTAMDSITVTATFTASATIATGTIVGHIVVIEKAINFSSAPGSNGETDFYGVMKKMLPSPSGTTLSASGGWASGSTQTVTQKWKLANIYDYSNIAVVAFVQDQSSKEVHQAAYSAPVAIPSQANASSAVLPIYTCNASVTPTITVKNTGSTTLTSTVITYQVDAGTAGTYTYTSSLAAGASASVTMPTVTPAVGAHTYKAWVTTPATLGIMNNASGSFTIGGTTGGAVPVTQAFTSATFPPSGYYILDPEHVDRVWQRSATKGANGTTSSTYIFLNWNNAGSACDLMMPSVNLATQTGNVSLDFWYAAAGLDNTESDELQVVVSTDCGSTWATKWDKIGTDLYTGSPSPTTLYGPVAADWRQASVDLTSYIGQSNVLVAFRGIAGPGNAAYVDEINLKNSTGIIESNLENAVGVFPNPSSNGQFTISNAGNVTNLTITNSLGEVVKDFSSVASQGNINVNLNNNASGVYLVKVTDANGKVQNVKVNVIK